MDNKITCENHIYIVNKYKNSVCDSVFKIKKKLLITLNINRINVDNDTKNMRNE